MCKKTYFPLAALVPWHGAARPARQHLQLDHEVWHRHTQGPVRQQRHVRRLHHVPGHRGPHAEGDHGAGAQHHEDQDHCAAREKVLGLDRWFHLGVALHFPVDVDLKAGVWRVWTKHCSPKMLLNKLLLIYFLMLLFYFLLSIIIIIILIIYLQLKRIELFLTFE